MVEATFQQPSNRFRFPFRGVGYPSGQDEPAQVNDDVLLVLQSRRLACPGGLPAGVGINWVQRHPGLWALEVPHLLTLNTIVVNGGLGQYEKTVFLDGLFLELRHRHPAGFQSVPAHVGFDQAGVHVHLRQQHPQSQQLVVQTVEYGRETVPTDPVDEVADGRMVETPGSSMVKKQNQR